MRLRHWYWPWRWSAGCLPHKQNWFSDFARNGCNIAISEFEKTENFCWQEGECCGILLKLSLRGETVKLKSGLKRIKKFLTNGFQFDIINKLFRKRRRSEKFDFWKICFKNFEKSFKKFLTNEKRSDIINKLSMRQHPKPSEDKMLTHFVYLGRFPYEIDTRCNFPLKAKENCTL